MEETLQWIEVAQDELQTLHTYALKLPLVTDQAKLREIMGDEVNHVLQAITAACKLLNLSVPTDNLFELNDIFEGGDEL